MGLAELVDRLSIVNIKLFKVKDEQTKAVFANLPLLSLVEQDINLCRERSIIKNAIDSLVGRKASEVKLYG